MKELIVLPRSLSVTSMLRDFDCSMFENTQVKSISGATVSDVLTEINRRDDLNSFQDIVIHVGTNDISKNIALDETTSDMEAAVTLLMVNAPTTRIHISAVCPRIKGQVHHKVNTLNEALKELSSRTDCNFIDSGSQMIYKNGHFDKTQLNPDGLHLSNRGVETLKNVFLETVLSLVKSVGSWAKVDKGKKSSRGSKEKQHRNPTENTKHQNHQDRRQVPHARNNQS